eukprot:scaffold74087_cov10-Tisochrysis_lutea.AAC.1
MLVHLPWLLNCHLRVSKAINVVTAGAGWQRLGACQVQNTDALVTAVGLPPTRQGSKASCVSRAEVKDPCTCP